MTIDTGRAGNHQHCKTIFLCIDVETKLWEQEAALLFASLSNETAEGHAYIFQKGDGSLVSFADKASFHKAVEADKALRRAQAH